jgi:drug/metabolite transporter (DMT)-like permease
MSKNLRAILLMSLSVGILAALDSIVKIVNNLGMHPFEIVFFRNVFGLMAVVPFFMRIGFRELRTKRLKFHVGRGCIHAASMITWFWALTVIPLADATALSFMVPVFASIGAVFIMREKSIPMRWISIAIGFIGMIVILRPGFAEISLGTWLVLGGTIFVATSKLMTKSLTRTESPSTIVAYMSLTLTFISFFPAAFVWTWPTAEMWLWFVALGSMGSVAHVIQAQSLKDGDVTLVEPAGFMRLVWAAAIGFIIFGEVPQIWSWLGAGVIMVGVLMLIRAEARTAKSVVNKPLAN